MTVPMTPAALTPEALARRGLNLCAAGGEENFDAGVRLLRAAIAADEQAVTQFSLGEALASRGFWDEAAAALRRAIALRPDIAAAHTALARVCLALGDCSNAAAALRDAIARDPAAPEPYVLAGTLLCRLDRAEAAQGNFATAIALAPDRADAWTGSGKALLALGRLDDSQAAFSHALELDPNTYGARIGLGDIRQARNDHAGAMADYQRAIEIAPAVADARSRLSNALYDLDRIEEAAAAAAAAIALQPDYADAHSNHGNALQALLRHDEAEAAYREAIRLAPGNPAFHSNLSVVLTALERLDEALASQRTALEIRPDFVDASYNHAITLLKAGHYEAGWRHYETRWKLAWSPPRLFPQPRWAGEHLHGRTILLHPEQGLGDTLQMARYAPLVAARGGRVVLEAQAPLVRLLRCLPGVDTIIPLGAEPPEFDVHCPLFTLPLIFGSRLDTLPAAPYLSADPVLAEQAARLFPAWDGGEPKKRVGLVWGGAERIGRRVNQERSIPLDLLAPFTRICGVQCYSLQMDPGEAAGKLAAELGIIDLMTGIKDFADTAARVAHLDLVISVDTSTAHLAAAMGKPVWLLSRHNGCWRWLTGRADSPWYPSLRLYRQERPRDWAPAIARIAADLRCLK